MYGHILVAVDLVEAPARFVIERAQAMLRPGGRLDVLHVVEPQYVQYSFDPTFTGSLTRALEAQALETARKRLAEICAHYRIPIEAQRVVLARAADGIHEQAKALGVDAIVIGSRDQRGFRRLLGSTANAVLHGAPVNVLVARLPARLPGSEP